MHAAARVRSHDTTALILYYGWGVRVYLAATPVLPSMATSNNSIIIITLRKLTFIHTVVEGESADQLITVPW